MKTKKFIEKVKEMGFLVVRNELGLLSVSSYQVGRAKVSEVKFGVLDTNLNGFEMLNESRKSEFLRLLTEYALTPINEREEPKLYYVKAPGFPEERAYLNKVLNISSVAFGSKNDSESFRTRLTEEEIKSIDPIYWEMRVEVENE